MVITTFAQTEINGVIQEELVDTKLFDFGED